MIHLGRNLSRLQIQMLSHDVYQPIFIHTRANELYVAKVNPHHSLAIFRFLNIIRLYIDQSNETAALLIGH